MRLLLLVIPVALFAASSGTWTQWRGPNRTGEAPGKPWPAHFQGLRKMWSVPLDKGYPGPLVTADRVFVVETANGETEIVRALDRATGKELWRASWPGKHSVPFFAKKNGDWVRSTPAFDGKTLYVGGMEEVMVALDGATGKQIWRVDIPARFNVKKPDFGFASSPLVDGDALYLQAAHSLVKLDKRTGNTIWRTLVHEADIMESGAFSTPTIATIGGKRQVVLIDRKSLSGVDPETGKVLWTQEVASYRGMHILTPVVYAGDSVFTSPYRVDSFLYRVRAEGGKFAVEPRWTNKLKGYMSTPVLFGDFAYLHMGNQRFACIDMRSGDIKWTTEPFGQYWSMVTRGDKILALDERGELHLIRANPEKFESLATKEITASPAWAHLAVAGDELFVRELNAITAWKWEDTVQTN